MDQRITTLNHASINKDELCEASMAGKSNNISGENTKHDPASASEYKSLEEYRAEVFGNKLRSARNK